jgi:hypothetical protein
LSDGNEIYSLLAGLAFEFGPFKMISIWHLQNLSIFYLPLIVLVVLQYLRNPNRRKLLGGLFILLVLQFYGSWYQMAFVLMALAVMLALAAMFKLLRLRPLLLIAGVIALAALTTAPLAKQYADFSKANHAAYGIGDQITYSASLADYAIPYKSTLLGRVYYHLKPHARINSYNPDSYSYHGLTLYVVAVFVLIVAWLKRKRRAWRELWQRSVMFWGVLFVGFIVSLGPVLKIFGRYDFAHMAANGHVTKLVLPLPYLLVDHFLPSLSFIRAIGRASILVQFSLVCSLALMPVALSKLRLKKFPRYIVAGLISALLIFELMPTQRVFMSSNRYYYHMKVPAVYQYIKSHDDVDNLIVLAADRAYPGQKPPTGTLVRESIFEQVLWAGYHNKNTFNGYSGYIPPEYFGQLEDFIDFRSNDIAKMRALGLRYILVDKTLSRSRPQLNRAVAHATQQRVFEDQRYALYKI